MKKNEKMRKKYHKIRDSKKFKLLLLTITLLLVTIGSTYAWWTASKTVEQKITMGNLNIEADFKQESHTNYEPGTYAQINGLIKNTGSIPALIKIDNGSKITFAYADDELTPIALNDRQAKEVDPNAITIDCEPETGDYLENKDVWWFTHENGSKYLLMEPSTNANVCIKVNFDGKNATNKYMDASIEAKAQLKATQVIEEAIVSEFGIESSDLITLPATKNNSKLQSRLQELLQRAK